MLNELQVLVEHAGLTGEGTDRWVWKKDPSEQYTVSSAYKWLRLTDISGSEDFYDELWRGKAPLKVKGFVWKLAQDRIPSLQNLVKRTVTLQSILCRGCEKEVESSGHLFFKCELFPLVWRECLRWWGMVAPLQGDCKLHFLQFAGLPGGNSIQKSLWQVVWFSTIWVIWVSRNALIFKGKKVEVGEMLEQVKLKS